jgi:hypothetical protein
MADEAKRLETLRKLAEGATPGSWKVDGDFLVTEDPTELEFVRRAIADLRYFHQPRDRDNAAFVAAMDPPTAIGLLDEIAALRAALEEVSAALVTAQTLMMGSGAWVNAAGHQTDAALWIEVAMQRAARQALHPADPAPGGSHDQG